MKHGVYNMRLRVMESGYYLEWAQENPNRDYVAMNGLVATSANSFVRKLVAELVKKELEDGISRTSSS